MKVVRITHSPDLDPRASEQLVAWLPRVNAMVIVGSTDNVRALDLIRYFHQQLIPALHIADGDQLEPAWFDDVDTVGLLAFPSTPAVTIDQVHRKLRTMGRHQTRNASHADKLDAACHARTTTA